MQRLKDEFEPQGIEVYPISAVTGKGVKELLYKVKKMLDSLDKEPVVFEREYFPEEMYDTEASLNVYKETNHVFVVLPAFLKGERNHRPAHCHGH